MQRKLAHYIVVQDGCCLPVHCKIMIGQLTFLPHMDIGKKRICTWRSLEIYGHQLPKLPHWELE